MVIVNLFEKYKGPKLWKSLVDFKLFEENDDVLNYTATLIPPALQFIIFPELLD